jgi:hypothetical protein
VVSRRGQDNLSLEADTGSIASTQASPNQR